MRIDAVGPFDADGVLAFLAARTVPAVEEVDLATRTYRRGRVRVRVDHGGADVTPSAAAANVRRLLAVDVAPGAAAEVLAADPVLAPLVAARPGLRVPGAWDPFEVLLRAIVGQQVTVAAARTLLGRVVTRCGVSGRFPTPTELLAADLTDIGMPGARVATVSAVAAAVADGLDPTDTGALLAVRGVGPWTAAYVAMRLGELDAFPIGDVGLRMAAAALDLPTDPKALLARAEQWRLFRAVATLHLWSSLQRSPAPGSPAPAWSLAYGHDVDDITLLRRAVDDATRIIDGITPAQLDAPTPCPDFTVDRLLNHLVGGVGMLGTVLDPDGGPPGEDWKTVGQRLVAAAEAPADPNAMVTLRHGEYPRAVVIQQMLLETAVHAADLAQATGQQLGDDAVYERVFGLIPDEWRRDGVISPAVPCADDAPLVDRVLAFAGRAVE